MPHANHAVFKRHADVVLTSDAGLAELYELKGGCAGSQADCQLAVDRRTGVSFALQAFDLADLLPSKCDEIVGTIAAHRRLADPPEEVAEEVCTARLACITEVLLSPARLLLVSALAPTSGALCDDLLSVLQRRGRLGEADARRIFARLVLAVKRAHDCGTVLRGIKPECVHVAQASAGGEYQVWLAQLHCAAAVPPSADEADEAAEAGTLTGLHGTPEYAAPEVTIWYWHEMRPPQLVEPPPPYGAKADIWALGMCLHVMLCGCFPFKASLPEEELLRAINTANFAFNDPGWRKVSEEALDLVSRPHGSEGGARRTARRAAPLPHRRCRTATTVHHRRRVPHPVRVASPHTPRPAPRTHSSDLQPRNFPWGWRRCANCCSAIRMIGLTWRRCGCRSLPPPSPRARECSLAPRALACESFP